MHTSRFISAGSLRYLLTKNAHRRELALETTRKGILPDLNLVCELGSCNREGVGGNVHRLEAVVAREQNQRSGQVVDKECFMSKHARQSPRALVQKQRSRKDAQS